MGPCHRVPQRAALPALVQLPHRARLVRRRPSLLPNLQKMLESFEAWDEADAADDVVAEVRSGKSQRGEKRRAATKSMRFWTLLWF